MRRKIFNGVGVIAVMLVLSAFAGATEEATGVLETGYRQMYNLDFGAAHESFTQWEQTHPEDPVGPASNAAAYLFGEFERLNILEVELFTHDDKFESRSKLLPDPSVKSAFDAELTKSDAIANRVLAHSPRDADAMFARVLANGLRGDYASLVEKRNLASLSYMKNSRTLAEKLLAENPSYYDAYLAVGVENYLLSQSPAPVRWLLRISGAETDKSGGIAKLRLTAAKGHFLAPFARLLLAVAALRDKDRASARNLLDGLAREFPRNQLYKKELDRIAP